MKSGATARRFKVAFVAGSYLPQQCGMADYIAHLRQALQERGVDTIVFTDTETARTANDPSVLGAVRGWRLRDLAPLVRILHLSDANIVHIQYSAGNYDFRRGVFFLPLLAGLFSLPVPLVTTLHEYGWWEWRLPILPTRTEEQIKSWGQTKGYWDRENAFLLTLSSAVITTHDESRRMVLERLPQRRPPTVHIPIASTIAVYPAMQDAARLHLRERCAWPGNARIIVFFGFLHPVKGLETLLEAFRIVLSKMPSARLLLLGGIESLFLRGTEAARYRDVLLTFIARLGLDDRVYTTGYVSAEAASLCLSGSDVGVLPFDRGVDMKCASLLALMAHGLPVVATFRDPPVPQFGEGLLRLVPPRDPGMLAAEIMELLKDRRAMSRMSVDSVAFARKFSWAAIAEEHIGLYRTLAEGKNMAVRGDVRREGRAIL
jgi:glycosyltransferase involved in cell wall biosynthesis